MALPYPYEAETGQLKPQAPVARAPFDIAEHIRDAIVARGSVIRLFGVEHELAGPELAATMASGYQEVLTRHFQERHPLADAEVWQSFESQARAQLERSRQLDDSTMHTLLMTVDGL